MRGYASLMSDFQAHRYNVLVLQQMSCGAPAGARTPFAHIGFDPANLRLVNRIPLAD